MTIGESWFTAPEATEGLDILCLVQQPGPFDSPTCRERTTLISDLTLDPVGLESRFNKKIRHAIRQAEREDLAEFQAVPVDPGTLGDFHAFYRESAQAKGISPIPLDYLEATAASGCLDFSLAREKASGEVIVWHAHLLFPGRARLHWSASRFRAQEDTATKNQFGRVNRLLHWRDLQRIQAADIQVYDWGGWAPQATSPELESIYRFKEAFGGTPATEWSGEIPYSIMGRGYLAARKLLGRRPW